MEAGVLMDRRGGREARSKHRHPCSLLLGCRDVPRLLRDGLREAQDTLNHSGDSLTLRSVTAP